MSFGDWIDFKERSCIDSDGNEINIQGLPDICPHCNRKIHVELEAYIAGPCENGINMIFLCFQCPACKEIIIGKYDSSGNVYTLAPQTLGHPSCYPEKSFIPQNFSELLNKLSPNFSILYNQAAKAEHYGCEEIAGVGYRKALEFLIKDFVISQYPKEADSIRKTLLGKVIQDKIESKKIKAIAQRAVWLGNDETHYERKWIDKDLHDLKALISITAYFIESELAAADYIKDMPFTKEDKQ